MKTGLPLEQMLKDVEQTERLYLDVPSLPRDLCCHVKALAAEVEENVNCWQRQCQEVEEMADEVARLRAALEMLAQVRHVSGSAQAAFRSNLRLTDAVLAGADVRDLETVAAIAEGTWQSE